ncbi:hypothetical protein BDR06DRAFT_505380 [Suillus hirtellus]|nr:hypothetical protein BDR06DRAFT_505380 [Suillus hirtellus]
MRTFENESTFQPFRSRNLFWMHGVEHQDLPIDIVAYCIEDILNFVSYLSLMASSHQ